MTFWYRGFSCGPPSTVKTKTGLTNQSMPLLVMSSNSLRCSSLSQSRPWLIAVEEECFPDRIAMYVEPEHDTASLLPTPSGMIRIPAYTEGISLCWSATTQSWSSKLMRCSTCISNGLCLFAAVTSMGTRHLSSWLIKHTSFGPRIEESSSKCVIVAVQNSPSTCFAWSSFCALIQRLGCLVGSVWGNQHLCMKRQDYSGFTFSHYDLPFPTRYCIPYVRSGLYQLVICVKGIRVCVLHCVCAWPRFALHSGLSIGVDTTLWESRVVCRQCTDHVGCFCCRAIVKLFCCC